MKFTTLLEGRNGYAALVFLFLHPRVDVRIRRQIGESMANHKTHLSDSNDCLSLLRSVVTCSKAA